MTRRKKTLALAVASAKRRASRISAEAGGRPVAYSLSDYVDGYLAGRRAERRAAKKRRDG
jgi:hypothetical protein